MIDRQTEGEGRREREIIKTVCLCSCMLGAATQ